MSRPPSIHLTPEQRIARARSWAVAAGFDKLADHLDSCRIAHAARWAMKNGFHNVMGDLLQALVDCEGRRA